MTALRDLRPPADHGITVLEAALWWVRTVPVVPVAPVLANGPRPLVRWKEDGPLRTEAEVREFWVKFPTAQIAIMLGKINGESEKTAVMTGKIAGNGLAITPNHANITATWFLGAIDTDVKHRKDGMPGPPAGFVTGYRHSTKSGGTHDLFLYRIQPPGTVARRSIGVGGFVDVLLAGLLVVPPTTFDGAGDYRVVRAGPIPEFEAVGLALDQAAPWLRQAWKDYRPKSLTAGRMDDREPILEGARRSFLLSWAGRLRDIGLGETAILAALRELNEQRCLPPLPETEVAELARDVAKRYVPTHEPSAEIARGKADPDSLLWPDLLAFYRAHFHFADADEWAYTVVALLTLERWVSDLLPAAFSAAMAGTVGRGKTRLGELMRDLTGAEFASNVSPAALARTWRFGNLCVMDEADEGRGREQQEMLDAFMRAYRPGTGLYKRVKDPRTGEVESIDLYGPRLILGRSSAEAGIQSRCYDLPAGEPVEGEPGFEYVRRGMYPEFMELRGRLERFAARAHRDWPKERVEMLVRSADFPRVVGRIVRKLGSNRESETGAVAAIVAEIAGVDVSDEMRRADEARKGTASTEGDELEMLKEAVLEVLPRTQTLDDGGEVTLRQPQIRKAFNALCKREGTRAPGNTAFSKLRLDLGVGSGWTREWSGTLVWHVPARVIRVWKEEVEAAGPPTSTPTPHSPRSSHPPQDENGGSGANGACNGEAEVRAAARAAFDEALREEGSGS